jgi:CRP-like cAMP-binding protein
MVKPDSRKLKDEAAEAAQKGKWKKAGEIYRELEKLEPSDGGWPQRGGEMWRRLGRKDDAVQAYGRSADLYSKYGFLLKAVAVCKIILELDPGHTETQTKLAALHSQRSQVAGAPTLLPGSAPPSAAVAMGMASTLAPPSPSTVQAAAHLPKVEKINEESAPRAVAPRPPPTVPPKAPPPASAAPPRPSPPKAVPSPTPVPDSWRPPAATPRPTPVPDSWRPVSTSTPARLIEQFTLDPDRVSAGGVEVDVEPPPDKASAPRRRSIPPGAAIDKVSLGSLVPGARRSQEIELVGGVGAFEIPLDLEQGFDAAFEQMAVKMGGLPPPSNDDASQAARTVFPKTPLFSALDEPHLRKLIESVKRVELAAGEILFRQGDDADALYVVADGEVCVLVSKDEGPSLEVARLGDGAFFGEISIVTSQPRNATIQATTETQLLAIDRHTVSDLVEDSPQVLTILLRFLRDRLLSTLVDTSALFAPFSPAERHALAGKFRFLEVEPGALIVEQGKKVAGLFVLLAGQAAAIFDGVSHGEIGPGDVFGEMSLLSHSPAVASVRAVSKIFLLELPRAEFTELIMTHPQILEFASTLAEERQKKIEAVRSGESHLPIVT